MNDITPVIAMPATQRIPVENMVRYCMELDGTQLKVVEICDEGFTTPYPHNRFPCLQASALHAVAMEMKGQPFIWIEPDSIPIKPGWKKALIEDYHRIGKPFMLPVMPDSKYDIGSGIGIYPGDTHFLVPVHFPKHGWDYWLLKNLPGMIGHSHLIQHNYGEYGADGHVKRAYRFPQDNAIIRPETVLFHRDRHQDLIKMHRWRAGSSTNVFLHSGDLGDIIASLPAIRELGGGKLIITYHADGQRESMKGSRYESIVRLVKSQPYISGVEYSDDPEGVTHDISTFRKSSPNNNLATWQASHLGVSNPDLSKWVEATPDPALAGKVAMARSMRYRNPNFPWRKLIDKYQYLPGCFFVGLPQEHFDFQRSFERRIDHVQTHDLMELAEALAGVKLFIGNQSCPFWLAAALGVPLIQETWEQEKNSIIERPNARYFTNGTDMRKVLT